ncbi:MULTISPECIES: hypothetical protein [Micromonospora]|uniref:Uncharacterized protein n=1 Tax=Micromonospora sicca TaxID=2202420 RepID=A0ABU5JPU4_9ACTN|nr:hypothetical protein [Micromonospora sp. 4G53]MDZ5494667.1 hypothetical protein [Micromonospora sp. 4G53]
MVFPADRFTACPTDEQLPPSLATTIPEPRRPLAATPTPVPAAEQTTTTSAASVAAGDDVGLAVEVTRVVPASGTLTVCGQQFWLSPTRAGLPITLWADTTVVHLLLNGVRLKTLPSQLTPAHLRQLLADDGTPAQPPPIATGPVQAGAPIEVDRLVNATGLISLAGRQHPVGYHFAGQRVTVRLDRGLMQITADGVLLRSLPNPLTTAEIASIRDARPAGPPPTPTPEPVRVERRVRSRGALPVNASMWASPTPEQPSLSKPPTPPSASMTATNSSPRSVAPPTRTSPGSKAANPSLRGHLAAASPRGRPWGEPPRLSSGVGRGRTRHDHAGALREIDLQITCFADPSPLHRQVVEVEQPAHIC